MRLAAIPVVTLLALAGCTVAPVPLGQRICATNADCITGYFCAEVTEGLQCIPVDAAPEPDAGPPMLRDAARLDAARPSDAAVDASAMDGSIDAAGDVGTVDSGATDAGATDAGATDAGATDAGAIDAATDLEAGTDAAVEIDADIDVGP